MENTELRMLVGFPGCGKSTYAKELEKRGYRWHSSDNIREEYGLTGQTREENVIVFRKLHERIKEDLKNGINCIYDATNLSRKNRMAFLQEIKSVKCTKICCLMLVDIEECKRRNQMRDAVVPDEVYSKFLTSFNTPAYFEGWDNIEVLTSGSFSAIDPEAFMSFSQDNRHHTLTLGEHMKKAYKYTVEAGADPRVIRAAKYHDIGKPMTKRFENGKGEPTTDAHYYGHEHAGSYLYLITCAAEGIFSSGNEEAIREALYISTLIDLHMRPLNAWSSSNKSREKDRRMMGEDMFQDLIVLNTADVTAH